VQILATEERQGEEVKPRFPSPHISFSSMADFGYCPRYWYLLRKHKPPLKGRETPEIIAGRHGHIALHLINKFIKTDRDAFDAVEVKRIFDKAMRPLNLNLPFYENLWQGIRNHAEETHASQPPIFEVEYPLMVKLETKNDGVIWIVGTLDRLDIREGVATLWDYKITYLIPTREELDANEQFTLYSYLIWKEFPQVKRIILKWHAVLAGKSRRVEKDLTKLTAIEEHLADRWHAIRTEKTWPTNAPCARCDTCPQVCTDYKAYLRQVYYQKDIKTFEDKAVVFLAIRDQMGALKKEHKRLDTDIKKEIAVRMGEPVIAAGREWKLSTQHREGGYTEPTDFTKLVPVKLLGTEKGARQRASEKGKVGSEGNKDRCTDRKGGKGKVNSARETGKGHQQRGRRSGITGGEVPTW